jgi:multiple sugar transport system substrate-binding protein
MSGSTTMLFYNKKLLAAAGISTPPATQAELAQDAIKLTHYNAASPTSSVYGIALPDNNAPTTWEALMQGNGGGVISDNGKKSLLGSAASIKTIKTWTDLLRDQHIGPTDLAGAASDALFEAGKVAFNITGPWASAGYAQAGIDFGVVDVPAGTVRQAATLNADDFAVNAKATSAQTAAAYAFMKYYDSTKSQLIYSLQSGVPPILTSVTAAQLASNPTAVTFSNAKGAMPQYPGQSNFAKMQSDVFVPTLQKIENGSGTAASLLPAASQQITSLIK